MPVAKSQTERLAVVAALAEAIPEFAVALAAG